MITQTELLTKRCTHPADVCLDCQGIRSLNTLLSLNFDKSWRKFAVKVSNVTRDAKVLDVCTGTGDLAIAYSKMLNVSGNVIGTDFCLEMIKLADQKLRKKNLPIK